MKTAVSFTNKTIVITGATSGIGRAISLRLAKRSNRLILIGRNQEALLELKTAIEQLKSTCTIIQADLADATQVEAAIQRINASISQLDVLINNVGVSQRGLAMSTALAVDQYIMNLNYFSIIQLTKGLYPLLQAAQQPRIIVLSSMSGKFGFHFRSAYAASKHALHGFFESMQVELMHTPLRITLVCPGRVKTGISLKALTQNGEPHNKMDEGQSNGIAVEVCVTKLIQAAEAGKFEIHITQNEHWLWMIKKVSTLLFLKIASKIKV